VLGMLAAAGAVLQPAADSVTRTAELPAVAVEQPMPLAARLGRGTSIAILGGCRALAADLLWLETYLAWSAGDRPATEALIRMVTTVDERPVAFWLNGARMIAFDLAQWRLHAAARDGVVAAAAQRRIHEEQAAAAVELLAEARRFHPRDAAICIELANVELYGRADLVAAARWYRTAAELPRAPYCAARIHGELLERLGRRAEAYAWLRRLHPTLPPGEPEAMAGIVLSRIRRLERTLPVPAEDRYVPPDSGSAPGGGQDLRGAPKIDEDSK
jgi:hypothetical protein